MEQLNLFPLECCTTYVSSVIFVRYIDEVPYVLVAERLIEGSTRKYTFPGGKFKSGETFLDCAVREVFEEIGLHIYPQNLIESYPGPIMLPTQEGVVVFFSYFAFYDECTTDTVKHKEQDKHKQWKWISIPELIALILEGEMPLKILSGWWLEEIYLKGDIQ